MFHINMYQHLLLCSFYYILLNINKKIKIRSNNQKAMMLTQNINSYN